MRELLPPRPVPIRVLRQEESDYLSTIYPHLPKSLLDCPTCGGDKSFRWYRDYGTNDEIVEYVCPCSDQFIMFKYFLHAGIGKQGQRMSMGDIGTGADPQALHLISDYLANARYNVTRGMGLLFYGTHGAGKTMLTMILTKKLLAEGVDCYFTPFTQLLDNYAQGWRDKNDRQWFDRKVRNADILVIDDIGKENANLNNMAKTAIDGILRSRVQNALPTIITTNLSLAALTSAYSTGVMSLVSEVSLTHEFTGKDWRPNQRERNMREVRDKLSRPIVVA